MNIRALIQLWNTTQQHRGTSGARVCTEVLLGLYNGSRFPMDLTELRCLDGELFRAAIDVITDDTRRCQMEVHEWLNRITGRHDFGCRFEHLAWDWKVKTLKAGRCKKAYLDEPESQLSPRYLVIKVDEAKLAVYDSEQKALDKIEEQYSDPGNWVEQQVN